MECNNSKLPLIAVIMGPTASGKSALALQLAKETKGEIVSIDSMQIYRHLAIGTAQPTWQEQQEVPHHLINMYELSQTVNVYDYVRLADDAIQEITRRGKLPILAGGTGFYLKALLYGLDDLPGDAELRKKLNQEYDCPEQEEALYQKLHHLDAASAEKFRDCRRRMLRALEVFLICGKSILTLQTRQPRLRYRASAVRIDRTPEELKARIAKRTGIMLENGWIDEARSAIEKYDIFSSPTAWQALGYKQIHAYLQGQCDYERMRQNIVTATWQFARRQRTWFAHQHPEAAALSSQDILEADVKQFFTFK